MAVRRNAGKEGGAGAWIAPWQSSRVLRQGFAEYAACAQAVHEVCRTQIRTPPGTPRAYRVTLGAPPASMHEWRRNLFSTLFHSVYLLLEVEPELRVLFSRINHLFRIWVTSADNLLDGEDKATLPLRMPTGSRVMRQVVAVMAADRALAQMLNEAVCGGVLSPGESAQLLERTLGVLLPSAAQEASEEGGVVRRPRPAAVLRTIHRLKTGLLFNVPFVGLEVAPRGVAPGRLRALRAAMNEFGIGCQILDDIRDVGGDLAQGRHNYLLSVLWHGDRAAYEALAKRGGVPGDRLYREVPGAVRMAAREARRRLRGALDAMRRQGLDLTPEAARGAVRGMFTALDVEDVRDV
jgi:hypothetical protein